MAKLTDKDIAAMVCPPGKKDILKSLGTPPGFMVRVYAGGAKQFIYKYRLGGPSVRHRLGWFGEGVKEGDGLTLREARIKADVAHGQRMAGLDPQAEITARKEARAQATKAAAFTLRNLVDLWDRRHLSGMRPSYRNDALARLNLHLVGLMDRAADSITRRDASAELDRIAREAGDTTARRVMGYARSAYGWAQKRGDVETNPFHGLPKIGREVSRDRTLTGSEIGAIWRESQKLGVVHGGFVRFLLLTLARRDEVASMTWAEIAPDLSTWTLPAERAKNGKAHIVHLSQPARAILAKAPRIEGCALVFALPNKKSVTTFSYLARKITAASGVTDWTFHDFRRAGVSTLASLGFPPHVCDRLLNHVQGTIKGVAAIYQRHDFAKERAEALEAWAAFVTDFGGQPPPGITV